MSSVSRWLAPRLASPLTLVRSSKRRRWKRKKKKKKSGGGEMREGKGTQVVLSRTCLALRRFMDYREWRKHFSVNTARNVSL